jgi:hypothetical protein
MLSSDQGNVIIMCPLGVKADNFITALNQREPSNYVKATDMTRSVKGETIRIIVEFGASEADFFKLIERVNVGSKLLFASFADAGYHFKFAFEEVAAATTTVVAAEAATAAVVSSHPGLLVGSDMTKNILTGYPKIQALLRNISLYPRNNHLIYCDNAQETGLIKAFLTDRNIFLPEKEHLKLVDTVEEYNASGGIYITSTPVAPLNANFKDVNNLHIYNNLERDNFYKFFNSVMTNGMLLQVYLTTGDRKEASITAVQFKRDIIYYRRLSKIIKKLVVADDGTFIIV